MKKCKFFVSALKKYVFYYGHQKSSAKCDRTYRKSRPNIAIHMVKPKFGTKSF